MGTTKYLFNFGPRLNRHNCKKNLNSRYNKIFFCFESSLRHFFLLFVYREPCAVYLILYHHLRNNAQGMVDIFGYHLVVGNGSFL